MAIWLPGYTVAHIGPPGGSYDMTSNPKLCWHTTEGDSIVGAETAFADYPPHLGVDPDTDAKHQYVPLDRRAYSLGNSDAEDSFVIQVEVVGYASESHDWPQARLDWLRDNVVVPVAAAVGVPAVACPQGFHGEGEGIILASASSPIRFNIHEWDAFAGHVGHQHCPGDDHWDPGRLNINAILKASKPKPPEDVDMAAPAQATDSDGRPWLAYKGKDKALWLRVGDGEPWSLGGEITDAITLVPGPRGQMDVYAYTPDGAVYSRHGDGQGGWSDWYGL